jgi:hypothetical protein
MQRVYYNSLYKLVRYDMQNAQIDDDTFNSQDPLVIIHDFNVGVAYGINKKFGNCSCKALTNNTFDEDAVLTQTWWNMGFGYELSLKTPEQFLELDADYAYTGQRKNRGIETNVFLGKKIRNYGNDNFETINEYLFSIVNITNFSVVKTR